jgi:hypothetical protein
MRLGDLNGELAVDPALLNHPWGSEPFTPALAALVLRGRIEVTAAVANEQRPSETGV